MIRELCTKTMPDLKLHNENGDEALWRRTTGRESTKYQGESK